MSPAQEETVTLRIPVIRQSPEHWLRLCDILELPPFMREIGVGFNMTLGLDELARGEVSFMLTDVQVTALAQLAIELPVPAGAAPTGG